MWYRLRERERDRQTSWKDYFNPDRLLHAINKIYIQGYKTANKTTTIWYPQQNYFNPLTFLFFFSPKILLLLVLLLLLTFLFFIRFYFFFCFFFLFIFFFGGGRKYHFLFNLPFSLTSSFFSFYVFSIHSFCNVKVTIFTKKKRKLKTGNCLKMTMINERH